MNSTNDWADMPTIRIPAGPAGPPSFPTTAGPIPTTTAAFPFPSDMRNILDLTNRIAVVIGATSGIGRAISLGLAAHGAHVVPTGRRGPQLEEVCCAIEKLGVRTL